MSGASRPVTPAQRIRVRRAALLGAVLALAAVAISGYLTAVKLAGELPACGPLRGCETVATSPYSEILGIPVAVFGVMLSLAIAALQLAWWWTGDRRALLGAYGLGLAGVVVVGYLTALELFVIHAVCAWCAAYAGVVVAGWLVAALAVRRS
jgi:uncharacterized membrane protein